MTGPDRIWIDRHGGNWSPVDGGTQDVEYIRRDPAVLAALPEVQAMIAAAYEVMWKARAEKAEAERDAALAAKSPHPYDDVAHSDDHAVNRFAAAMKGKLQSKRLQGRGGWDGPDCNAEILSWLLREHVEKGDPLDVGNLAMMLHQRGERIAAIQPDPDARQAALAKAFCMGRDAAAAWHTMQAETAMGALCCGSDNYEIRRAGRVSDMHRGHSEAIRALTPPADLAAKIGGE